MPSIKFNCLTKEIEMKGTESFIESNFDKIHDILIESFGVKKKMALRKTETNREPIPFTRSEQPQASAEAEKHDQAEASPISSAREYSAQEMSHELKAKRPPVRKYIRKVGTPGKERIVVEVAEQKQKEISLASVKEKFGLSESKIGGIIRDTEKMGNVKKVVNGSYVWTQD
jgi:hypothetical protein